MFEDSQVQARGTLTDADGLTPRIAYPATLASPVKDKGESVAKPGEYTLVLLREVGYAPEENDSLAEAGTTTRELPGTACLPPSSRGSSPVHEARCGSHHAGRMRDR
jgi:hypothetical protein